MTGGSRFVKSAIDHDDAPARRRHLCASARLRFTAAEKNVTAVATSRKITIALVLCLVAHASPPRAGEADQPVAGAHGDLAVSPAVVEWALPEAGRSNVAVRVANLGREPLRIDARIGGWTFDDGDEVRRLPPQRGALSGLLEVYPARVEVPAGEHRTLRLWLHDPAALPRGEHRALLRLRADRAPASTRMEVDLAIYAYRGPLDVHAELRHAWWRWCDGRIEAGFDVANDGERHVRLDGWLVIEAADGALHREHLPTAPVLPGAARMLPMRLPWPAGAPRRVRIEGQLGERDLREWIAGDWPPIACAAP